MEELKYYTPEISELYVGYECEIDSSLGKITVVNIRRGEENKSWELDLSEPIWNPYKVDEIPKDIERFLDKLRTPFLTKEQIEAEGWNFMYEDFTFVRFLKSKNNNIDYQLEYDLEIKHLSIGLYNKENNTTYGDIFVGKIKSINEFRTLCKYLEIC